MDVIATLIQGLVDIEEEWERVGKPIEERKKKQREVLRDAMLQAKVVEVVEENSGYKAVLKYNSTDTFDAAKLIPMLPRPELAEELIVSRVDGKAVQRLVDGGMLNRTELEQRGALIRGVKTAPFVKLVAIKGRRPVG